MIELLAAAVILWRTWPLDESWSRLQQDALLQDVKAFAAERKTIVELDQRLLEEWGATRRETFESGGNAVETYNGPTRVRGERKSSAYFAVVTPAGDFKPPTFWELTPAFSPGGGQVWVLTVNGCRLDSGDPVSGHVRYWHTQSIADRPSYEKFKATLTEIVGTPLEFPDDTATAHTPGASCLYVGGLTTEHLFPETSVGAPKKR